MRTSELDDLADRAMRDRGLDPEYSDRAHQQAVNAAAAEEKGLPDLRRLPWCSIDNGEGEEVSSRDLDQLSSASLVDGVVVVRIAISDVDALVSRDCPVDIQALRNTTTVYCASKTYPMIDPRFSENLTSLAPDADRLAVVTEMRFGADGDVTDFSVYRALVRSRAKLNYVGTGDWLADRRGPPLALTGQADVCESLLLQDQMSQNFQQHRRAVGSLALESLEARAAMQAGKVLAIKGQLRNRATELIENLMIAGNGCTSRYLAAQHFPSLQRVVRKPKFWSRIVELAAVTGHQLPESPDSGCLQRFLEKRRVHDPVTFPDLCLSVLKLLGRGEYVVDRPGQRAIGHFGLAVREYSHSTAPNRRYPDLITQRLIKASLGGQPCPYSHLELEQLAKHCNQQESNAKKVERQTEKSAAALMLAGRLGEVFQVVVSGVNQSATWVRMLEMPVEGMFHGRARLGEQLTVKLVQTDVAKGFIDFEPVGFLGGDDPSYRHRRHPLGGKGDQYQNGKVH